MASKCAAGSPWAPTDAGAATVRAAIAEDARGVGLTSGPWAVAEGAVAMLEEARSNAARHAQATSVEVSLTVASGKLTVAVADDGIGLPRPAAAAAYSTSRNAPSASAGR